MQALMHGKATDMILSQVERLENLIFPDYPDGNEDETEQSAKEKEADISTSLSGCSYTPRLVNISVIKAN